VNLLIVGVILGGDVMPATRAARLRKGIAFAISPG
jgi:hypothetical protein